MGASPLVFGVAGVSVRDPPSYRRPPRVRGDLDGVPDARGSLGRAVAHPRVRRSVRPLSAGGALADHPVHLLKRESSSSPAGGTAPPAGAPFSMNTIECCDGMSNFLPHVLQVTESSTRII